MRISGRQIWRRAPIRTNHIGWSNELASAQECQQGLGWKQTDIWSHPELQSIVLNLTDRIQQNIEGGGGSVAQSVKHKAARQRVPGSRPSMGPKPCTQPCSQPGWRTILGSMAQDPAWTGLQREKGPQPTSTQATPQQHTQATPQQHKLTRPGVLPGCWQAGDPLPAPKPTGLHPTNQPPHHTKHAISIHVRGNQTSTHSVMGWHIYSAA